jgi:hypothetical protein
MQLQLQILLILSVESPAPHLNLSTKHHNALMYSVGPCSRLVDGMIREMQIK